MQLVRYADDLVLFADRDAPWPLVRLREILGKMEMDVVVAFGLILRRGLLDFRSTAASNVLASLLPKFRGVSPSQTAILTGEKATGCTTMHIDEAVDTSDMLLQDEIAILDMDTAGMLSDHMAELARCWSRRKTGSWAAA